MADSERFECRQCGKVIEFERPLFCPYCGQKIDPTDGLVDDEAEVELYPASRVAPLATNLLVGWGILLLPAAFFFGRKGVVVLSLCFVLCVTVVMAIGLWRARRGRGESG